MVTTEELVKRRSECYKALADKGGIARALMSLKGHGGQCCGIRHIYNLGASPKEACINNKNVKEAIDWCNSKYYYEVSEEFVSFSTFVKTTECKTNGELFNTMLDQVFEEQESGCIEVVVSEEQEPWFKFLEKAGFKRVSEFGNSNSGNYCYVYHLYYGQEDFEECRL